MNFFLKALIGGASALFIYRMSVVVRHLMMSRDPDNYLRLTAEDIARRSEVTQTCDAKFQHIRSIYNVHSFAKMNEIIAENKNRDALLFKGFIREPQARWAEIEESHKDVQLSFTTLNLTSYGSMWTAGVKSGEKVEIKLGDFFSYPQDPSGLTAPYASFIKFLRPRVIQDSDGKYLEDFIKVEADTDFVSNFPRDVLATPIHAAPLGNSFSFLFVGRKFWLLASPEVMEKYEAINTPSTMLLQGSEKEFFEKETVEVAIQEPGDMLYFPGHYGHAVVTKEGPNAMCVLRQSSLVDSFLRQPWRTIESIISLRMTKKDVRIFSHKHVNTIQRTLLMSDKANSPCADMWSAWMRE